MKFRKATFVLPLIDRSKPDYNEYYETTVSSSVTLGIGFGLIPVIEEEFAKLFGIEHFSILYRQGELSAALIKATNMSDREIAERQKSLSEYCQNRVRLGVEAVNRMSSGLFPVVPIRLAGYYALEAVNVVVFCIFCVLIGWIFHFNLIAIGSAAVLLWLTIRYQHQLVDFWRYKIKRPLAKMKRALSGAIQR